LNELTVGDGVFLGIIQGLTEFLPVSSSAHLAIAQKWLGLKPDSTPILLFDMATHVGTLVALWLVFAGPIHRFLRRLKGECRADWPAGKRYAWRIAALAVAATIPTGVIGLLFKKMFEAAFNRPVEIGIELIITGALLAIAASWAQNRGRWRDFRWWHAGLVGVAQAVAILPGISRSGATISVAALCGLRRQWAAQFSFLIAFPAILGATTIMLKDTLDLPRDQLAATPWGAIAAGTVASLVVGILALVVLLRVIRRAKLHYFSWYCYLAGIYVLVLALF